jgi:hypothetical protein
LMWRTFTTSWRMHCSTKYFESCTQVATVIPTPDYSSMVRAMSSPALCLFLDMISDFLRQVDEICAILGFLTWICLTRGWYTLHRSL